jgi:phytoene dehydrogenase-like protein
MWRRSAAYTRSFATAATKSGNQYDAIVVGGGHNGLVAAAYLAKAGKRVVVLERRHVVGGAAVTEEIVPGFKFSRASYVYSLFRPQIVQDLDLHRHGLQLLPRVPSSFTPSIEAGGPSLILGAGEQEDLAAIAKLSVKDSKAYAEYNALLERFCAVLRPLLDQAPPDPGALFDSSVRIWERLRNLQDLVKAGVQLASLGREIPAFVEIMTSPASKILDRWFENPVLKATLATDAVIGAMAAPSSHMSAYVLLHHVMCGTWKNVKGGMGALTQAIAKAAVEAGAEIRTDAPVKRILVDDARKSGGGGTKGEKQGIFATGANVSSRVTGVELNDGTVLHAPWVLANPAPRTTFLELLPSGSLPSDFEKRVGGIDYSSGVVKINVALDKLPNFTCAPNTVGDGNVPMPHHRGTIHFETHPDQIEAAYKDAVAGRPSTQPVIEMTIPTALDSSLAPPGKHVALLFVQYAPYHLPSPGGWDAPGAREAFAKRVYSRIDEFAPGFSASVIGQDILTPVDLERVFGLPGGNIFHGAMGLDQLFWLRPASGAARYHTPVDGLLLAGAGSHPGGGVMGAAGRNAALLCLAAMARK